MESSTPQPPSEQAGSRPGKIRTWWHPLLANLLRWQLGSHYHLEEEVPVGQKPLQIDLLLLQKEQGELPAYARAILRGLVERFGEWTLIEFKSPSDTLRLGDFQTFLAYVLLYRAQNNPLLDPAKLHLMVLAPKLTKPYREEMQTLGVTAQLEEPGIWRLQGGALVHPMWVLETSELAGVLHPLLTVVSPEFLADRLAVYDMMSGAGYDKLMSYMVQQIRQFRMSGQEFAMQHLGAQDEMRKVLKDMLKTLPHEDIVDLREELTVEERLQGLPTEELLKRVPVEERLEGLEAEEVMRALKPEALDRLRKLLQQPEPPKADKAG